MLRTGCQTVQTWNADCSSPVCDLEGSHLTSLSLSFLTLQNGVYNNNHVTGSCIHVTYMPLTYRILRKMSAITRKFSNWVMACFTQQMCLGKPGYEVTLRSSSPVSHLPPWLPSWNQKSPSENWLQETEGKLSGRTLMEGVFTLLKYFVPYSTLMTT